MTKEQCITLFNAILDDPWGWQIHANSLIDSGKVLLNRSSEAHKALFDDGVPWGSQSPDQIRLNDIAGSYPIAYYLIGMGIENLLKSLLLSKMQRSEVDKLPDILKGHKLKALAERSSLALSESEEKVLEILTEIIVWRGRYLAPKTAEQLSRKTPWEMYFLSLSEPGWGYPFPQMLAELIERLNFECNALRSQSMLNPSSAV